VASPDKEGDVMRETFIKWRPSDSSFLLLVKVNQVLKLYEEQGYKLTLRQLYYQLVARGYIPNNVKSYNNLGNIVSKGRLAGMIDWNMIEDRVRVPAINTHWDSPEQILKAAADSYYRDHWEGQKCHVEVWCEKDAVSNIIEPVARKYDVTFMANRGYSSQSAMYEAYQRMLKKEHEGKEIWIIYLGDHDPSGIDMTRDIRDRMALFFDDPYFEGVNRIALNMDQVDEYDPPENPAKTTDSRYEGYVKEFGRSSWELDALEPGVLSKLVEDAILRHLDVDLFNKVVRLEKRHKKLILAAGESLGKK
jgi:hypothetical protein